MIQLFDFFKEWNKFLFILLFFQTGKYYYMHINGIENAQIF